MTKNRRLDAGLTFLVVAAFICLAEAYPTGPPSNVCGTMTPGHGFASSAPPAPYSIVLNPTCYTAGQALNVTLIGTGSGTIDGFLVEARTSVADDSATVGTFNTINTANIQTITCSSGTTGQAIAHSAALRGLSSISFQWTPPDNTQNRIIFVATVVQSFNTYWVKGVQATIDACASITTAAPHVDMSSNSPLPDDSNSAAPITTLWTMSTSSFLSSAAGVDGNNTTTTTGTSTVTSSAAAMLATSFIALLAALCACIVTSHMEI